MLKTPPLKGRRIPKISDFTHFAFLTFICNVAPAKGETSGFIPFFKTNKQTQHPSKKVKVPELGLALFSKVLVPNNRRRKDGSLCTESLGLAADVANGI